MGRIGDVNNVIELAHGGGVHVLWPWGMLYLGAGRGADYRAPVDSVPQIGRLAVG